MYSHSEFIQALVASFPELREQLAPDTNLTHIQMGTFARFTQAAIDRHDENVTRQCFELAHRFFHEANAYLKNEFYVSYLEELDLQGSRGDFAGPLMSAPLQQGWREINSYLAHVALQLKRPPN